MDIKVKYLDEYIHFIKDFEGTIKKEFNIQNDIYLHLNKKFKSRGKVNNYDYYFHGAGCRIEKDKVICEYDYLSYENNLSYQLSLWKLKTFIDSFYNIDYDANMLKDELENLVIKGVLKKLKIDNKIYDVYILER